MKLVEKIAEVIDEVAHIAASGAMHQHFSGQGIKSKTKYDYAEDIKQLVLSDPSIVEIEVDAELPTSPYKTDVAYYDSNREHKAYKRAQRDMAGWVKKK